MLLPQANFSLFSFTHFSFIRTLRSIRLPFAHLNLDVPTGNIGFPAPRRRTSSRHAQTVIDIPLRLFYFPRIRLWVVSSGVQVLPASFYVE